MRKRKLVKDLHGLMEMLDDWGLLYSSETVRDARDEITRLREVLTRFVASFEGVGTKLTDEQEAAYEEAATYLDGVVAREQGALT